MHREEKRYHNKYWLIYHCMLATNASDSMKFEKGRWICMHKQVA